MSNILPIDDSIVPAHVTEGYLKNYSKEQQKAIAALYEEIEENAFSTYRTNKLSTPRVILLAGSQGAGKSRLSNILEREAFGQSVRCDVDSILKKMPVVKEAIAQAESEFAQDFEMAGTAHYDANAHRKKVEEAVEKYRPAAKYISDRLMSSCIAKGVNVIIETNAKTPHIKDFIDALKKSDVILQGHICEAPLPLKISNARNPEHGFAFPEDILVAENAAFRSNVPTMLEAMKDNVTVWFRLRANEPSKKVITLYYGQIIKGESFDSFEALFAETIPSLQISNLVKPYEPLRSEPKLEIA